MKSEAEVPKNGTRGAGGIVDSRLFFRVVGALHIPPYRLTGGLVGQRFSYQAATDREIPIVALEPIAP